MKRKPLTQLSIFELKNLYEESSRVYGRSIDAGDSKAANKEYHVSKPILKELLSRGHEGRAALLRLMTSDEPWVRIAGAGAALRFAPEQAEPVLEELATTGGACGFNAEIGLREWRKGNIKFDD